MMPKKLAIISLLLIAACTPKESLTDYVDPFIGTAFTGHTFPGAILPFGMVSASPDTDLHTWSHCSGYHYDDTSIMGFSQTHMSGTGANDMCDLLLMPVSGEPKFEPGELENPDAGYRSRFSHQNESARPGYYSVKLEDYDIDCEVTVTQRCPFYRFSFPKGRSSGIIFDMTHGNDGRTASCEVEAVSDRAVKGYRHSNGFIRDHVYYFWAEFSEPIISTERSGDGFKLYAEFKSGSKLLVKMGVSTVSSEAAKANLDAEIKGWNFDKTVRDADAIWNAQLSKIKASFPEEKDEKVFYTAMYHSLIVPNLISDSDGGYRGWDAAEHHSDVDLYTNYSLWDTYRAVHPLFNIICPERNVDFINSMLERYRQIGSLPINEYGGCETYCMIGYHAVPVIADAILQDIKGFDVDLAYKAMKAISEDELVRQEQRSPSGESAYYKTLGYIPSEYESNSVSKVLEYCYDDWCIARVAEKLGFKDEAAYYYSRSLNYRNIFDTQSGGFTRGKMADGSWRTPFNPYKVSGLGNDDYTEGNAWQYTFYVPQDMTNYVQMNGGDEAFCAKLDEMYSAELATEDNSIPDVTGLIGQYAHGNEPSHHTAYLYNFAGKPWKTQQIISRIRKEFYLQTPDGLCGNDDCGQMSAWYIFSALGFYPVTPGSGYFVIGSPSVRRASIEMPDGKVFTVSAPECSEENIYIQSVKLNGQPYTKSYFTVEDIASGAFIEYEMGPEPKLDWGRAASDRPVAAVPQSGALH